MRSSRARLAGALCAAALVSGAWAAPAAGDEGHESWWPQTETTPSPEPHDPAEHETHVTEDPTHEEDAHDTSSDDHGTDDHGTSEPVDRPLPVVLGAFGALNGGVLLFAAVTRRRERAEREAKQAQRAQRRSVPATVRSEES